MTETDWLAQRLFAFVDGGQVPVALLLAALGGLLTAATPCVYPLIPITVRYFAGTSARPWRLATLYVLGMVLVYASLGTLFASLHLVFGSFLASPWVLVALALLCAGMGLSMLGLFTLQLPPTWSTRLVRVGNQSSAGAFTMGMVSGLIAAPCTGPVLTVILALIAKSGETWLGVGLMSAYAVGLGLPFLVLAVSSQALQRLPKSGPWLDAVKGILAVAMFLVAAYFAKTALPELTTAIVWARPAAPFVALIGVVAFLASLRQAHGRAAHTTATLLVSLGIGPILFAPLQSKNPMQESIQWITSYDQGMAQARENSRPVMIDFTADWCQACKELDHKTYPDPRVRTAASRFVSMKLDASRMDDDMDKLFARYQILGLPTVVFIDSTGSVLKEPRVTGFLPPEQFAQALSQVR